MPTLVLRLSSFRVIRCTTEMLTAAPVTEVRSTAACGASGMLCLWLVTLQAWT